MTIVRKDYLFILILYSIRTFICNHYDCFLFSPLSLSLQDSTFEFEKRRNMPVRYDRDLMSTTLKAMKRVAEIRARRERVFYKNR